MELFAETWFMVESAAAAEWESKREQEQRRYESEYIENWFRVAVGEAE